MQRRVRLLTVIIREDSVAVTRAALVRTAIGTAAAISMTTPDKDHQVEIPEDIAAAMMFV